MQVGNRKSVKPRKAGQPSDTFEPITLEPEDNSDIETFHAFTIGETDYHGVTRISFTEAKAIAVQLDAAIVDRRGIRSDEIVCRAVYGDDGWLALDGFKGLRREHYTAVVAKATDVVLASMGKA